MSDEKTYTAGDMRQAYTEGGMFVLGNSGRITDPSTPDALVNRAIARYPDPKKPRVIISDGFAYRVDNGMLHFQCLPNYWLPSRLANVESIPALADLLAHPYEESK